MDDKHYEALVIAQEECAEVIQAISKCMRFGIDQQVHNSDETNADRLNEEVGDLMAMIDILVDQGILTTEQIDNAKAKKVEKLHIWSSIFNKD